MSDHKNLALEHRGFVIKITYWIDETSERKIVGWNVRGTRDGFSKHETLEYDYVREPLGGRPGIFGYFGRPEKSFHELVATAVEQAIEWINENEQDLFVPDPDEVAETLEIRGYDPEVREW